MFLENDYAEPLFSFHGGPAKAYRCKICKNKVTSTEGGMRSHLRSTHNWVEQPCLSSMDNLKEQSKGAPRKLRAGPPLLRNLEKQEEVSIEKKETTNQPKNPEMNEGELLKLMREEN
jgi:hypothetical protein